MNNNFCNERVDVNIINRKQIVSDIKFKRLWKFLFLFDFLTCKRPWDTFTYTHEIHTYNVTQTREHKYTEILIHDSDTQSHTIEHNHGLDIIMLSKDKVEGKGGEGVGRGEREGREE